MTAVLHMTWQRNLVNLFRRKQSQLPPVGLRNLGNSCYLNSVLQCLTHTPPLANLCLRYLHASTCNVGPGEERGDCPFCLLEKRIARSLYSDAVVDSPLKIHNCLKIYGGQFRPGRQEDAHEFLRFVLDACHNTCIWLKRLQQQQSGEIRVTSGGDVSGTEETVVKEIFGGELQSQLKCLSCGAESNKVDEIMDMSLDIANAGSLREAVQNFFQPEMLDGNNKYKCDKCKELVDARKQMSIFQAPNVLVIQLKRFDNTFGRKIDKDIALDEMLELSSHMCKASQDQHPEYNLFGTIVHSGFSADSGHYYSYIKDAFGRWYCCNDSNVSLSTLQQVLSQKVYVLFFCRTKLRPRSKVDILVNESKSHELNDSETSKIQNDGCLEKPFSSAQVNNSTKSLKSNGTRLVFQKPGCSEKPVNVKLFPNYSEKRNSTDYCASNRSKTSIIQRSDGVETSMDQRETSTSTKLKVDGGFLVNKRSPPEATGSNIATTSRKRREPDNLLNEGIMGSSNKSGMIKKTGEDHSSILLARDSRSLAVVEAFKELIEKDASKDLQSCGWSDEVYNFMHARKKLCQEAGTNDQERKALLISQAKRNFTAKVPESLKTKLIDYLTSFSKVKEW